MQNAADESSPPQFEHPYVTYAILVLITVIFVAMLRAGSTRVPTPPVRTGSAAFR